MTLVLACLTRDAVYQISDRRLVSLTDPTNPIHDETNKAVLSNGRAAFGYTGISQIGGEETDRWLARIISTVAADDMGEICERIRAAGTVEFSRLQCAERDKRHAFLGTGWFKLKGTTAWVPGLLQIDNAIQDGKWLDRPRAEFKTRDLIKSLRNEIIVSSVGVNVGLGEKAAVFRLLRTCAKHKECTPRRIVQALAISMRWLSNRYPQIGKGLMVISLPRIGLERAEIAGYHVANAGEPSAFTPSFLYLTSSGQSEHFGPIFVSGTRSVHGFRAGDLP